MADKNNFIGKNAKMLAIACMLPAVLFLLDVKDISGFELKSWYGLVGLAFSVWIIYNKTATQTEVADMYDDFARDIHENPALKRNIGDEK